MKRWKIFAFSTLISVFANNVLAVPMLSADGSHLSSVEITGYGSYDVFFGDGLVSDVFNGVIFDDARQLEATAVSIGIVEALNGLGIDPGRTINGCGNFACILFNPEAYIEDVYFIDRNAATGGVYCDTWCISPVDGFYAATNYNSAPSSDEYTIVQYRPSSQQEVPVPATITLLFLGFAGLAIVRRKRATRATVHQGHEHRGQALH